MKTTEIKTKIAHPDVTEILNVPVFEAISEALVMMGEEKCLGIINGFLITKARSDWRTRIIDNLHKGVKGAENMRKL